MDKLIIAKVISIKKVKDPGIVVWSIKFKVDKKTFEAYLGHQLDRDNVIDAMKLAYEQQTLTENEKNFKESLPGRSVEFFSTV